MKKFLKSITGNTTGNKKKVYWFKLIFPYVERVFAIVGLVTVIYVLFFDLSVIISNSMSPTLQGTSVEDGDWVLSDKFTYIFRQPRRWELITFNGRGGVSVIKRIVGLPTEKIRLGKKTPVINGKLLVKPKSLDFLSYYSYGTGI